MGYLSHGLPGQRAVVDADDRAFVEDPLWILAPGAIRPEPGPRRGDDVQEHRQAGDIKAVWIICTNPVATVAQPRERDRRAGARPNSSSPRTLYPRQRDQPLRRHPAARRALGRGDRRDDQFRAQPDAGMQPRHLKPPGEAMPDWRDRRPRSPARWAMARLLLRSSAAEVFDEITRAWNPKTGYDIRGASHARLRRDAAAMALPARTTMADRHPIRYLNDGVSQTLFRAPRRLGIRRPARLPDRRTASASLSSPVPCLAPAGDIRTRTFPIVLQHRPPAPPVAHDDQDRHASRR